MKALVLAAGLSLAAFAAQAQAPASQPAAKPAAAPTAQPAPAPSKKLSVQTSTIGEIIENEQARAALEAVLPNINAYYEMLETMTLAELAPNSRGALNEAKLKQLQAEFDKVS